MRLHQSPSSTCLATSFSVDLFTKNVSVAAVSPRLPHHVYEQPSKGGRLGSDESPCAKFIEVITLLNDPLMGAMPSLGTPTIATNVAGAMTKLVTRNHSRGRT